MALNIKDPKTDQVVRRLARTEGVSITEAVLSAAEERLRRIEQKSDNSYVDDIMAIARRVAAYPVADNRSLEDMLYDENGLPK
jgi:antitoxin VapB